MVVATNSRPDTLCGRITHKPKLSSQRNDRVKLIALTAAVVAVVLAILMTLVSFDTNGPKLVNLSNPPPTQASAQISYDFLGQRPFEAGRMWLYCFSSSNSQVFLLDIDKAKVVGQLTNGWPITLIEDEVLCTTPAGERSARTLRTKILLFVERMSGGRFKYAPPQGTETYWLLDLKKNAASKIGDIPNTPNFSFIPSPDYQYGYKPVHNHPNSFQVDHYCFDFKRRTSHSLDLHDWAVGWWDNSQILFQKTNYDFVLYDVKRKITTPFLPFSKIKQLLQENGAQEPLRAEAFCTWDGHENQFYITDANQRWLAEESFLIKVQRPDGRLTLVSPNFKFEWSDHFDPTGRLYLHGARDLGQGSDGVFLQDVQAHTNIVLAEPTTAKYHSIPRFYQDSVIYLRSNVLWKINLDGSHNTRLFPPP